MGTGAGDLIIVVCSFCWLCEWRVGVGGCWIGWWMYDPSITLQYSSPSSSGGQNQDIFSLSWPLTTYIPSITTAPSSSSILQTTPASSDVFFDPDFFSFNMGWMLEVFMSNLFNDGVWNHTEDWDGMRTFGQVVCRCLWVLVLV